MACAGLLGLCAIDFALIIHGLAQRAAHISLHSITISTIYSIMRSVRKEEINQEEIQRITYNLVELNRKLKQCEHGATRLNTQ